MEITEAILLAVVVLLAAAHIYTYLKFNSQIQNITSVFHEVISYLKTNDETDKIIAKKQDNILESISIARKNIILNQHEIKNPSNSVNLYRQIETAQDLRQIIGPFLTRNLRGWALSPDVVIILINYITLYKPKIVLELGGGYSTILIANYLKKNKLPTRIISVEHDQKFYNQTKSQVESMELSEYVDNVLAPLKEYGNYLWYDQDVISNAIGKDPVDLFLVDGPPESTNKNARLPFLEKLNDVVNDNVSIFLDDANRPDEKLAVEEWLRLRPDLHHEYIRTEKGLSLLTSIGEVDVAKLY